MLKFAQCVAVIAALGVAACNQKPPEDPKCAQLEKELKDLKDQAAASKDAAAGAAAGQAAATTAATDTAKDAQQTAAAAQAATKQAADENARLKRELDEMKPREFTLPAGTIIPVRTTAE